MHAILIFHLQGDRAKWNVPVKKVSYVFVSLLPLRRPQKPLNLLDLFLSWKCMFSFICVTNLKGIKEFFNFINSDENTRTLFVHNICLQSSSRFPLTAYNIKISPDFPGMKNLWKSSCNISDDRPEFCGICAKFLHHKIR